MPTIATPSQKQQAPKTKNDKTDNKPLANNIPQAKPKTDNKTQKNQVLQELANARAGRTTVDDNNKKPSTDVDSILMADPTRNNQTGKDSSQQGEPIMPASKPTPKAEVKPVEKPVHKTEVRHDKTVAPPTPKAEQNAETAAKPVQKTEAEPVKTATKPTVKISIMKEIREKSGAVMFVGDGINDAPVLAGADVSAAMGTGAEAAIDAADIVFMNSDMDSLWKAFVISEDTNRIAKQNIIFALVFKLAVMILGIAGFANMWFAVFADSGVAVLCIINSIRILKKKY